MSNRIGSIKQRFRWYWFQLRCHFVIKALIGAVSCLIGLQFLLPRGFSSFELALGQALLFFVCISGSWIIVDRKYCLRHLRFRYPFLQESISSALDFFENKDRSLIFEYFHAK